MKQINKKFLCIILILSIAKNSQQLTGLQKAVRLIQRRTTNFQHSNDILLKNKLIPHEQKCYNIQRLKQIIGIAWEHVFTDFGFNRTSTCPRDGCDYDLKNRNTKTVIELKIIINQILEKQRNKLLINLKNSKEEILCIQLLMHQ